MEIKKKEEEEEEKKEKKKEEEEMKRRKLKEYMEGTLNKDHQTTCVFYSSNRKKLSKKYYKIKKRFLDNPYTKIMPIDGFKFRHPLDSFVNEKVE